MTLRYLEIFLALARTPNMRDAAAKLFISQAAVSSALRDFEAELGVSLFDRMGRGIRLNDKGRLLEERLAPLYNQLKNVLALVASDELAGKIDPGTGPVRETMPRPVRRASPARAGGGRRQRA